MGKLTAIKTYSVFLSRYNSNKIDEKNLTFILETGQLYTHGIFINGATYGTEASNAVNLTIGDTTKSLSLSSHTHSNYYLNTANINIAAYKIVSGTKDLLLYDGTIKVGDTSVPLTLIGSTDITIQKGGTSYTNLDTGNFLIVEETYTGISSLNAVTFKYGNLKSSINYIRSINLATQFDNLTGYNSIGINTIDNKVYGVINISNSSLPLVYALLRIDTSTHTIEFRDSGSTNWKLLITGNQLNALNTTGLVLGPTTNDANKVWKTDSSGNPGWRDDTNTWKAANSSLEGYVPKSIAGKFLHANSEGNLEWIDDRYSANTDRTGIKLGTVSGTKKTDSTVIITNSGTGLVIQGGTNLFKIGNGTNYIEVSVTPSISNNVTGSGTSGKLVKWNGTNTITDGPALSSAVSSLSLSTKFLREDGTWAAPSYTTLPTFYNLVFNNGSNDVLTYDPDSSASKKIIKGSNITFTVSDNNLTIAAVDTWKKNTATQEGYVTAPGANVSGKVWMTGSDGTPSWQNANNHTHSYLPLSGGTLNSGSMIVWRDWGQWGAENPTYPKANGGLQWSGTSDTIKLFAEETASDDLRLVLLFGDDTTPRFEIRDKDGNANAYITTGGAANFTALTVNNIAVSLSGHKHAYTDLTGSSTTANQAIVSNGTANGWTLKTLGSNAFNSTAYLPLSGGTITGNLIIKGNTSEVMTYDGNVHPRISFRNVNATLNVDLIFTDYDSYRATAGIKLAGNLGNEWFEAPLIYLNGTKVSVEGHTHSYLPLSGGTMSGWINFSNTSSLLWKDGIYQLRILLTDDSTTDTAVFTFLLSSDSGSSWSNLLTIKDNSKIVATTFVGALSGNATSATNISGGAQGSISYLTAVGTTTFLSGGSNGQVLAYDATNKKPYWKNDSNTWTAWKGATENANGTAGYMPAPTSALREKFLRGDGSWVSLNNYSLPTASNSTLGGVKTGAAITDTTGYTAVAIKDGVIYYKDTNSTYSFSNLLFLQTSGTNLMTYNSQATRTVLAGSNITFTHSNNVLTIAAKDTTYSTVSKTAAGLCPALPNETTTTKYLRLDGTWVTPPNDNTWKAANANQEGYVPKSIANKILRANADGALYWGDDANSTNFLPLSGGTLTGNLTIKGLSLSKLATSADYNTVADGIWNSGSDSETNQIANTPTNKSLILFKFTSLVNGESDTRISYLVLDATGKAYIRGSRETNQPWKELLHSGNYNSYADSKYVRKAGGDTINNTLYFNYYTTSSGTVTNNSRKLELRADSEGGNIRIYAPDSYKFYNNNSGNQSNSFWEIDSYNGDLRFYTYSGGDSTHSSPIKAITFRASDGYILNNITGTAVGVRQEKLDNLNSTTIGRFFTSSTSSPTTGAIGAEWHSGITVAPNNDANYKNILSFYGSGSSNPLYIRSCNNGTWGDWRKVLDSSNYTNYTVTKTGSGASGTWNINISGSAGSVAWANITGKPLSGNSGKGPVWGNYVPVQGDGVMEIGKYLDFHNSSNDGVDYAVRLMCQGNNKVVVNLPTSSGTLALTSLIPTKASWNYDDMYVASVSISGNNLRINKNGANTDLTIPYATNAHTSDRLKVYTESSDNTNTYRLIGLQTLNSGWTNKGLVLAVASRHSGVGIYTIHYGAEISNGYYASTGNSKTDTYYTFDNVYCYIRYFGDTGDIRSDKIICHVKPDSGDKPTSAVFSFFLHSNDASNPRISILQDWGGPFTLVTNGATMSSIDTSTYGALKATTVMNESNSCTGNAASASSVAWGNVSSKPETATRWPSWSEVTSKPSTFVPSSHDHNMNDIKWPGGHNLITSATANGQEWSIDCTPGTYTGTYWLVWRAATSGINVSGTMLKVDCDTGKVLAPYGFVGNISGTATNASNLVSSTRMDYGWNGINYFNIYATNLNAAKVNDTPYSSATWTHILRFNHSDNSGYYTDLAIPFNNNGIYYKRIQAGSLQNSTTNGGWVSVLDNLNSSVSKSGETLTVKINGTSLSLTNTWREIKVNGTLKRSTATSSGDLDFINGSNTTVEWTSGNKLKINATNTWNAFTAATSEAAGTAGYIQAPAGTLNKFFRGDNTWLAITSNVTTALYVGASNGTSTAAQSTNGNVYLILKEGSSYTRYNIVGSGRASVTSDANGKITINSSGYNNFTAATADAAGGAGLVPGPGKNVLGSGGYFLRADGSWAIPTNTWKAANTSQEGYIPKLATGGGTIATQASEYVLTFKSGTDTTPVWRLLPSNAYNDHTYTVNNATYSIKSLVGSTTTTLSDFTANQSGNDDFTLVQGSNITFTIDTTNRKLTIAGTANTWKAANTSQEGYVPKLTTGGGTIATQSTEHVLTFTSGNNGTITPTWKLLPTNAFVNTWNANAVGVAGYVAAPTKAANANMTWQTDANGNPAWRASNNHSHSYLPLTGGTVSGALEIKYNDITNGPKITSSGNAHLHFYGNNGNLLIACLNVNTDGTVYWQSLIDGARDVYINKLQHYDDPWTLEGNEINMLPASWNGSTLYWFNYTCKGGSYTPDAKNCVIGNGRGGAAAIYGASHQVYSDIRYKDVIENISINLLQIANAPVFKFRWNNPQNQDTLVHIGGSAQYWKSIYSELVSYISEQDWYALDYTQVTYLSVISVARETLTIQEKLRLLESENNLLRLRITILENLINSEPEL